MNKKAKKVIADERLLVLELLRVSVIEASNKYKILFLLRFH